MEKQQKALFELTDDELLQESKKMKSASILNAILIGFLIGIIIYSIVVNRLGFFTLILLFFVFKLINNSKYNNTELKARLKERNLV
ncbi:MAG: FUSC family protein [Chitinophagaceae bacterium]|nr:MAG: FUSC family protein [Chitinophagaceae bacterium]